jgi:predicted nuclease with TOPRIM domain
MVPGYTQQELERLIAENESLRKQLAEKEEVVSKLQSRASDLQDHASKLQDHALKLQDHASELEGNVSKLEGNVSKLEGNVSKLTGDVTKLEENITKLESEITWLRKKIFGKMSERFISSDPDSRQLDIFGEQLSQAERNELEKSSQQDKELVTRTITVKKSRNTRKDISMENLRIEETVIDPEGINLDDYVCIGSEQTNKLAFKPAEFYIKRTTRRKFALKNQLQVEEEEQKERSTVVIAPLPDSPLH